MSDDPFEAVRARLGALGAGVMGAIALDEAGATLFEERADEVFPAASVIKLPLVMTVFAEAAARRVSLDEEVSVGDAVEGSGLLRWSRGLRRLSLYDLVLFTVAVSDNTAANRLIDRVGVDAVNRRLREWGCERSVLARRLYDLAARDCGLENLMTPRETAALLLRLLRGECVDRETSDAVLAVLERCEDDTMLKRYLGGNVRVAHKSGWMGGIRNDAGVVWAERPVVVAGFCRELPAIDPARGIVGLLGWCAYRAAGGDVPPLPPETFESA